MSEKKTNAPSFLSPKNEALWEHIEAADLISFDFFDTLFVRLVANPEDVFDLLGLKLGIKHFRKHRKLAQMEAFKYMRKNGRREISIADIYRHFPTQELPPHDLIHYEQMLELNLIEPNEELFLLFKQLINANKQVIITSDMYLPSIFFEQALEKHGISGIPIFCSADKNATKRDAGELFQVIIEELKIKPDQILHIGDNYLSDYQWADKHGLKAYHYLAPSNLNTNENSALISSIANSLLRVRANDLELTSYEALGFLYSGPAALALIEWIKEQAPKDKIDRILFLSRDGYIMQELVEQFYHDDLAPCHYFYGSRTAFTLAAITEENFTQYIPYLLSGCDGLTPSELLERIGVPSPAAEVMASLGLSNDITLTAKHFQLMSQFLYAYRWEILKLCQQNRRGLFNYLKALKIEAGEKIALVDIGWRGSSQEAFINATSPFIALDIYGYYFCLANPPLRITNQLNMKMHSLLNNSDYPSTLIHNIYQNRVMLEFLFSAPHDTVIGYNAYDAKPLTDPGRGTNRQITQKIDAICKGSIRFVELYQDLSKSAQFKLSYHELAQGVIELIEKNERQNSFISNELCNFDAWASSENISTQSKIHSNTKQ